MIRQISKAIIAIAVFVSMFRCSQEMASAQVFDGQPVNSTVTNNAYWKRNVNDSAFGIYALSNVTVGSGSSVTNMQREFNACSSYTGMPLNSVYNILPSWINNDVGSSTDPVKTRADDLTARFNATTGHTHTGVTGDAPQLTDASLSPSAAISRSKIAAGSLGYIVFNNASTGLLDEEALLIGPQGGTGVSNGGTLTWGSSNLSFTLSGNTTLTLPTSGTVVTSSFFSAQSPLTYNSGTGVFTINNTSSSADAFDSLAPTTTKGDLIIRSSTANSRFAVCPNTQVLVADSTQTLGWKCAAQTTATFVDPSVFQMSGGVTTGYMDSPDVADTTRTVSSVVCSMRNSGVSGTTVVTFDYDSTLSSTFTVSITANGGLNNASATPGVTLTVGDYIDAQVTSVADGVPTDLRCKVLY